MPAGIPHDHDSCGTINLGVAPCRADAFCPVATSAVTADTAMAATTITQVPILIFILAAGTHERDARTDDWRQV
jgi:hypothetical protein